jgi:hypothetical protein
MNFSIKPISDFVKKVKNKYKDSYNAGQDKNAVRRAREQFKNGAKDGMY